MYENNDLLDYNKKADVVPKIGDTVTVRCFPDGVYPEHWSDKMLRYCGLKYTVSEVFEIIKSVHNTSYFKYDIKLSESSWHWVDTDFEEYV